MPAPFARQLFVNLPVADLPRSVAFFTKLGFTFNAQFTNHEAACLVLSEQNYVMLLTREKFKSFTPKEVIDGSRQAGALVAISAESRAAVDEMCDLAVTVGGRNYAEPMDYGFMYQRSFEDPDGNNWEILYMDPDHA